MMYLFNAAAKTDASWTTDHTALYYALNYDLYVTRLGHALLAYPALLRALTLATFWLEWLGPAALFVPWGTARLRAALAAVFWMFHLGIAATLNVGLFPYVAIV